MMAEPPKMKPMTYTLSDKELDMLEQLVKRRHPTDPKAASMTVRECIRETYEREFGKQEKGSGK